MVESAAAPCSAANAAIAHAASQARQRPLMAAVYRRRARLPMLESPWASLEQRRSGWFETAGRPATCAQWRSVSWILPMGAAPVRVAGTPSENATP